jgi:hypothetical protein
MYQGIFDTDFDKYIEDAVALFSKYGIHTVFENLELPAALAAEAVRLDLCRGTAGWAGNPWNLSIGAAGHGSIAA